MNTRIELSHSIRFKQMDHAVIDMIQQFRSHPASVNETYWQHLRSAAYFSGCLFAAAVVCLVHAIAPCFFTRTGSRLVTHLHERMVSKRARQTETDASTLQPPHSPRFG